MKKTLFAGVCAFCLLISLYGKERLLSAAEIPQEITQFITGHFPEHTLVQALEERDGLQISYEVILSDNVRLEFDKKKNVTDIEAYTKLPDTLIPEKIRSYIKTQYPDQSIIAWERDRKDQSVKLTNLMELVFTLKGDFIKIDK